MKNDFPHRPLRVGLISLGCAKNLVDAEIMLGSLIKDGIEITNDATSADVVIVNTCSFIDTAQEESVDAILESAALREAHQRGQGLVVSGCLPQRFRDELADLLPEVDAFMGIDQVTEVSRIVREALMKRQDRIQDVAANPTAATRRPLSKVVKKLAQMERGGALQPHAPDETLRGTDRFGQTRTILDAPGPAPASEPAPLVQVHARPEFIPDFATPRFRLTPRHFAYVKIAEGCNHPCSFCIIPRMRGSHRSRAQSDVVAEARALIADGVKELNLISQDSTYYGLDLRPDRTGAIAAPDKFSAAAKALPADATTLCTLLRELNALPGQFWIRLLYTHPAHWTDDLIRTIAECPKVARYVDMPLQHIHHNMLERMRRETSEQYIRELIGRVRAGIPGIALRTTFIVGFPGETEEYFQTLLQFIRETKFERLGVFIYSPEAGTRAAAMKGKVPKPVKARRRAQAMAVQHAVAEEFSASFLRRTIPVLVDHEATEEQLRKIEVSSWEHGLVRAGGVFSRGVHGRCLIARGEADAPDIDGRVYVRGHLPLGEFARVRVIACTDYDLVAEPA